MSESSVELAPRPTGELEDYTIFGWAQIVQGTATCSYCDQDAALTIWNSADPDHEPVCYHHFDEWLKSSLAITDRILKGGK